ncbi:MAG: hypothetical protein K2H74_01085 [Paramuribaculum sp.]|nr:hypothetical protein [Paramuribaculum sp.]
MSFLNSFKKALGFSDEYEYDSDEEATASVDVTETETVSDNADATPSPTAPAYNPSDTTAVTGSIFDAVIKLFNETQPEFVRQCLSVDAQRAYILEHIDAGVRATIDKHIADARAYGEQQAHEQRRQMMGEIEKLKSDYERLNHQREEFQTAKLSASRQKRAMTERISDLENQVNNLIAEREQYQIENRSMANKLRIATMRIPDTETGELTQLEQILEENATLTDSVKRLSETNSDMQHRIEELETQLAAAESADDAEESHRAALEEIESRLADFEKIKERKNRRIEELQHKLSDADTLNEQLTASTDSLRKECDELRAEVKRLSEMINAAEAPKHESRKPRKSKKQTDESKQQPAAEEKPQPTVKISAIDELMDSTDWFTVPEAIPPKKNPEVEEDFGYKEPARPAPGNDSDKQLSLF